MRRPKKVPLEKARPKHPRPKHARHKHARHKHALPRKPEHATLEHVGSGKYSDVFKLKNPAVGAVMMKVSYYRDAAAKTRGRPHLDAIKVSSHFSKVTAGLMGRVSPHFVMVFCDKDATSFAQRLGPLLANRMQTLTPYQQKHNNVCFMEVFHANMSKFLFSGRYDEACLRSLVFQVVYTVAALQKLFPGFRHNDLSTNNVLIKKLRTAPILSYTVGGQTFYTKTNILPALSDYDFTNVPGHPRLANERVYSGRFKVDGRRNDSYDTHFFLKSVLKCIQRRQASFPDTSDFIKRLRLSDEDRQNGTVFPRLTPAVLLRDKYFAPLKTRPLGALGASYTF